jgi:hypothetical protein
MSDKQVNIRTETAMVYIQVMSRQFSTKTEETTKTGGARTAGGLDKVWTECILNASLFCCCCSESML